MKQSVLILTIILTLCTSCLQEGINGCPDYIRLNFIYDSSTKGYDETIANDVHLRLYKNGIIHFEQIIPYEEIQGGQQYTIKKEVTGEMDIVAWAIPAGEKNVATIPATPESRGKSDERIVMQPITRANNANQQQHQAMGHIYLGTVNYFDNDIAKEIKVNVPMRTCIAEFSAVLHTVPELDLTDEKDVMWLEVHGTNTEMDVNFKPHGQKALVIVPFYEENKQGGLETQVHGLLPSQEDTFISVRAYRGETHQFTIHTDYQAKPGDKIHLDIYGKTVGIQINDYRVFKELIWDM